MQSRYVVANGIRLHALEVGKGPLVLFCHGFPQLAWSWRHQLRAVGSAGYRAVAVDMPGYGRSDKPDVTYDVVWVAETLADVVVALGYRSAVLVGHDWGGAVVWPMARLHPDRVAGVVGVNMPDLPHTDVSPVELLRAVRPERPNYIVQFQEPAAPEFFIELDVRGFLEMMFRTRTTVNVDAFPDEVLDAYEAAFAPRGAFTPPLQYYRTLERNWELTADLAHVTIDVPCLMIVAEGDPVLTPALAEGMEERIPDLHRVTVTDCGHYTPEERPEAVSAAVLEFLSRLDDWP